jgi:hypothetical protein
MAILKLMIACSLISLVLAGCATTGTPIAAGAVDQVGAAT